MTTYKFVNPNLVTRDDGYAVAWDAATGMPLSPEEQKAWRDAGSPKPSLQIPRAPDREQWDRDQAAVNQIMPPPSIPLGVGARTDANARIEHGIDAASSALDKAPQQKDGTVSLEALHQQVQALTEAMRAMIAAMKA